jgi:hypothetical protein
MTKSRVVYLTRGLPPSQSVRRIFRLPPIPWQVLGVDLNRSESRRRVACPSMMPAQAPNFAYLCQASTEHFKQCAEFLLLCNRGLRALAVPVLPIPFARRPAATACAAVQSTAALFCRWRPAGLAAPGTRSALPGSLKLHGLLVCTVFYRRR